MSSAANEFRVYAEECLRWARCAKTEPERAALFNMARTWTQAAARIDEIDGVESQSPCAAEDGIAKH